MKNENQETQAVISIFKNTPSLTEKAAKSLISNDLRIIWKRARSGKKAMEAVDMRKVSWLGVCFYVNR